MKMTKILIVFIDGVVIHLKFAHTEVNPVIKTSKLKHCIVIMMAG